VLSKDWKVESSTPGVDRWLEDLPDGEVRAGRMPSVVLTVAGQALRSVNSTQTGEVAMARVLTRSGMWVVLHGAALRTGSELRLAVIVEPAHPARITELLMSAYGLTGPRGGGLPALRRLPGQDTAPDPRLPPRAALSFRPHRR